MTIRQRTIEIDGQKLEIVSRLKTDIGFDAGVPCGFYVTINDGKGILVNCLDRAEAESIALTKYQVAQRDAEEHRLHVEAIPKWKRAVSEELKEALKRYVETGDLHGDFITAVLENNLREAVCRADSKNLENLPYIVRYCNDELPFLCRGSKKRVADWTDKGGLEGHQLLKKQEESKS